MWGLITGGKKTTVKVTAAQFAALRQYPRNGTFVGSLSSPRVFQFVDGYILSVTSWAVVGGRHPVTEIDGNDLTWAGYPFPWDGVADSTVDFDKGPFGPTFIRDPSSRRVYKLVGGSPQYVHAWAAYGGPKPTLDVDPFAIVHAGQIIMNAATLEACPRDRWTVRVIQTGEVYAMAGGAPIYIASPSAITVPVTNIDAANLAATTDTANMRFRPRDQSLIRSVQTGGTYAVLDGTLHPTQATPWMQPAPIDQAAIDHAGQPGIWNHLLP